MPAIRSTTSGRWAGGASAPAIDGDGDRGACPRGGEQADGEAGLVHRASGLVWLARACRRAQGLRPRESAPVPCRAISSCVGDRGSHAGSAASRPARATASILCARARRTAALCQSSSPAPRGVDHEHAWDGMDNRGCAGHRPPPVARAHPVRRPTSGALPNPTCACDLAARNSANHLATRTSASSLERPKCSSRWAAITIG